MHKRSVDCFICVLKCTYLFNNYSGNRKYTSRERIDRPSDFGNYPRRRNDDYPNGK